MVDREEAKTRFLEAYHTLNSQFSRGQVIAISILVLCLILGIGISYVRSRPQPVKVEAIKPAAEKSADQQGEKPRLFIVHVAGAVNSPDVYELEKGERIVNAIKAAGGGTADADLDALNLAAKITDGQRVYVPRKGEMPQAPHVPTGGAQSLSEGSPLLISLNAASAEQLEELPGVGEVLAQRIMEHRAKKPFSKVSELQDVEGIGPKKFSQIKDKVTVD